MTKTQLKIFVVDDDPFCLALYKHFLLTLGYTNVYVYTNGPECIKNLSAQPDIIFTDLSMTPMDGLDIIREVKKQNVHIYIVVISGYYDAEMFNNSFQNGAFDYIVKGDHEWKKINAVMNKIENANAVFDQPFN